MRKSSGGRPVIEVPVHPPAPGAPILAADLRPNTFSMNRLSPPRGRHGFVRLREVLGTDTLRSSGSDARPVRNEPPSPVASRGPGPGYDATVPAPHRASPGFDWRPRPTAPARESGAPPLAPSGPSPEPFPMGATQSRLHAILGRDGSSVASPPGRAPLPRPHRPSAGARTARDPCRDPSRTRGSFQTSELPRSFVRPSFLYIIVPARAFTRLSANGLRFSGRRRTAGVSRRPPDRRRPVRPGASSRANGPGPGGPSPPMDGSCRPGRGGRIPMARLTRPRTERSARPPPPAPPTPAPPRTRPRPPASTSTTAPSPHPGPHRHHRTGLLPGPRPTAAGRLPRAAPPRRRADRARDPMGDIRQN